MSTRFGWCTTGQCDICTAVFKVSLSRSPNITYYACDCICHEGEEFMATVENQRARAYRPTAAQKESGEVPEYADVILEITTVGGGHTDEIALRWAGAHAVRDSLAGLLHENASKSIVERLEADLDSVMDRLMEDATDEDKGWARGLATAIAHMRGCDMDIVREQAMGRYDERTDGAA